MDQAELTRSMSKRACTPDNAACEGFFGRLQNEMYYKQIWTDTSLEAFTAELYSHIPWYNEHRIKSGLAV